MSRKKLPKERLINIDTAKATARAIAKPQRLTCEGCAGLRLHPRPMCQAEASPHFRMVRDIYHDRCPAFSIGTQIPAPPPEPAPMSRAQIAGDVPRLKRKRSYVTGDVAQRMA